MKVIGPNEPKESNKHRFILVAIDYFTKWIEVASYASETQNVPNKLITNNATNLSNMMTKLCANFKIQHYNSSPYYLKMNKAVEEANKNIKNIVQKIVVTYKD
ncbi:hypothetical protein CR513_30291, partial [Mucuna pruriens]